MIITASPPLLPVPVGSLIDPVAAEAWDGWFRWRDSAGLHDMTVEETWQRAARCFAEIEPAQADRWRSRFLAVLAALRVLPHERLLTDACRAPLQPETLYAAINLAAFVASPLTATARFDAAACESAAGLAVRMLDDAALLADAGPDTTLRIGFLGLADALALLGHRYDSDQARTAAAAMLAAVHAGCVTELVQLARERGAGTMPDAAWQARAATRGIPAALVRKAMDGGLRAHLRVVAESHPQLCLLANNVSDGLGPLLGEQHPVTLAFPEGVVTRRSSGYALSIRRDVAPAASAVPDTLDVTPPDAQLAMRGALQPWIDELLDAPIPVRAIPDEAASARLQRLARDAGLPAPRWKLLSR